MHDLVEHTGGGLNALRLTGTCLRKGCHCHQVQCMLYVDPDEEHHSELGQVSNTSFLTACMRCWIDILLLECRRKAVGIVKLASLHPMHHSVLSMLPFCCVQCACCKQALRERQHEPSTFQVCNTFK